MRPRHRRWNLRTFCWSHSQWCAFGGILALLALGLNLIFGVIDLVWICYAELIMIGMYTAFYLHVDYGWPLWLAFPACVVAVSALGVALHHWVIRPVLGAEPINQLLVTGGVLFFLQGAATLAFGVEFRNIGVKLPTFEVGGMFLSLARLTAFLIALASMIGVYLFLKRTYLGTAIRAISQDRTIMPLMGVNPSRIFLITSALGARSPESRCLMCCNMTSTRQSSVFRDDRFLVCVLGDGQHDRRLPRGFHLRAVHLGGRVLFPPRMGLRAGLPVLHRLHVLAATGLAGRQVMRRALPLTGVALLAGAPLMGIGNYPLHLVIMCLLWAFVYTSGAVDGSE